MRHHDGLLKTAAAIFLTAGMLFLSGCGGKDNGIEIVDLSGYEDGGMLTDRMLDSMAQEIRVIELSAGEDLTVPVYPERVKFTADRIYVLDNQGPRKWQMLAFDSDGRLMQKIGRQGRGPGEYFVISDFAVAPDGSLWINDAGMDNMLHYSSSLEYTDTYPMPYDIDNMEFLENGKVLVNVSQWDSTLIDIAVTDTMFRKDGRRELLRYSHGPHPVYGFGNGSLCPTSDGYLHNHPIDPDVYLIDAGSGSITRHYRLDLGHDALTYDDIAGLGDDDMRFIEIMKGHVYLRRILLITDDLIIGQLREYGEDVYFLADRNSRTIYKSTSENMGILSDCRNGWLISKVIPEKTEDHYKLVLRKIQ